MPLTTKDAIKAKLGITDATSDGALDTIAASVSARILNLTGRSDGVKAGYVELRRHVQQGRPFRLALRPVSAVASVEYRALGDQQWGAIGYDLLDPDQGEIIITGVLLGWPPLQPYIPAFTRWRMVRYPVVRITYDVADGTTDAVLKDLAASWGAYLFDREGFGAASEQQAGRISRKLMDAPMPGWVSSSLSAYLPSMASVAG